MFPIADSPCARDVAAWVAGGDHETFAPALAAHENASWTGGHTGCVDESLATFDHQECWIARRLALQGYNVIALPTRHLAGLRSPDAAVGGLLVEFKTYTGLIRDGCSAGSVTHVRKPIAWWLALRHSGIRRWCAMCSVSLSIRPVGAICGR